MSQDVERLQGYYTFPNHIAETVAEVAERQRAMTYEQFLSEQGVPEPKPYGKEGKNAVDILDIRPREHDGTFARVMHLPMANPLDLNMIYQAATIQAVEPNVRLIAVGNPSGPGHKSGLLSKDGRILANNGVLFAAVAPALRYLEGQKNSSVEHVGYSYGAETAAEAAACAEAYDMQVEHSVHIEPPAVKQRNLLELASDFASTNKELNRYVEACEVPAFVEARKVLTGLINYSLGLLRLTNIAIARALSKGHGFERRMDAALRVNENMKAAIIWGDESELAVDGLMSQLTFRLTHRHGTERMAAVRLPGQKHALANDIHLHAALVLEGLRLPVASNGI